MKESLIIVFLLFILVAFFYAVIYASRASQFIIAVATVVWVPIYLCERIFTRYR